MIDRRRLVGAVGEQLAEASLRRHGLRVVARNVAVGRGEVDILAVDRGQRVVVEVRTTTGEADPLAAFGPVKAAQVARLTRRIRAHRVDLIAIHLGEDAAEIRWVQGAA